jgi:hypothetical protein
MLTLSMLLILAVAGCFDSDPSAADKTWTKARLTSAIMKWEGAGITKQSATIVISCMARHIDYATYTKAQSVRSESQSEPPGFDRATVACVHLNKLDWQFNRNCADLFEQWGKPHPPARDEPLVIHKLGTRNPDCEAFLFPPGKKPLYFYRRHDAEHWSQEPPLAARPANTNAVFHPDGTVTEMANYQEPCPRDPGGPFAVLTPKRGPVGTRVRMVVHCVIGRFERSELTHPAYGVFLLRDFGTPTTCELIAGGKYRLQLVGRNRAVGWFTVARRGGCFQSGGAMRHVSPGRYLVGLGCHACEVSTFKVTS